MAWSKRELILQAFEDIGFASYVYDLDPERLESAMKKMDNMAAVWNSKGIRIGYPIPSTAGGGDLDELTNVPDRANLAITSNLALLLAPSVGKIPTAELKTTAKMTYDELLNKAALPREMQLPATMPMGAGNKPWTDDSTFAGDPDDPLLVGRDGPLDF